MATAAILLTIALGGGTLEPPVHLDLKVVDVPSGAEDDTEVAAWFGLPDESR